MKPKRILSRGVGIPKPTGVEVFTRPGPAEDEYHLVVQNGDQCSFGPAFKIWEPAITSAWGVQYYTASAEPDEPISQLEILERCHYRSSPSGAEPERCPTSTQPKGLERATSPNPVSIRAITLAIAWRISERVSVAPSGPV